MRGYVLSLVLASVALCAPAERAALEQRFAAAQQQFEAAQAKSAEVGADALQARRDFRRSAEAFAGLARDGATSASVCINAGNAYHFSGDDARALLWYLRAARLANTPEARAGVATLRRACKATPWPPPRPSVGRVLMSWHYDLGRRFKQGLLLGLYPAGAVLILVSLFTRRRRWWLRSGLALMILGGVMGISDAVAATAGGDEWAVVLEPSKGLSGDGQMYSTVVEAIAPGQEVRLVEVRPAWLQVELPNGTHCWVPADQCAPVRW